jgi:putative SOS response-associated peptidase YedK
MCGRYTLTKSPSDLQDVFDLKGPSLNLPPRYNLAPSQDAPVVRRDAEEGEGRALAMLRWGLVPSWSKEPKSGYSMINARAETVAEKPAFRRLLKSHRCLVPADGFYEWRPVGKRKQPYRIAMKDGAPFAFAGLWDRWRGAEGETIESFTIIVTEANALVRPIHDRMPVILDPGDYALWLGEGEAAVEPALALLKPHPAELMTAYPVDPRVNNPRNDDAELLAPLDEGPAGDLFAASRG